VAEFDTQMQTLLLPFAPDGILTLSEVGGITRGKSLSGEREGEREQAWLSIQANHSQRA